MTVLGGSYQLNVYPPHRGDSPNLADTHTKWDRGLDIATDSNLQETSLSTQQPALIVSDDQVLGKRFEYFDIHG